MAPFGFTGTIAILITLGIGFCFGFVLERAGFGNARNLAAQFYLHDMRVLKVMFTAIVTAMLLVFASSALGLLDFQRVWVPPTYLGPAVVGGLLLGVGFIVGGYCPGTSLVAASTLKVDGAMFAAGVFFGLLAFAGIVPSIWTFWNNSGAMGRLTLAEWLGVDPGVAVLGVVVMAVGAFWFAEQVEKRFAPEAARPGPSPRAKALRRAGVTAALLLAAATAWIGSPSIEKRIAWQEQTLDARLAGREVFIDPAELLGLMYDHQRQLVVLDVRSQADFNLFHLVDARHVRPHEIDDALAATLSTNSADTVIVTVSNDEEGAVEAWKRLAVHPALNAYILAGGVNRWLDLYRDGLANVPDPSSVDAGFGPDALRHRFDAALGARTAAARPDPKDMPPRPIEPRVHFRKAAAVQSGGCG